MIIYSSPKFEKVWAEIKLILDWHKRFSLFFVLSQDILSEILRERLQDYLKSIAKDINFIDPKKPEDISRDLTDKLFAHSNRPVWLELRDKEGNRESKWDQARQHALGLLNRWRSKLEEEIDSPLFIHLPEHFAAQIVTWAPDLWSIRQQIIELPAMKPRIIMKNQLNLDDSRDKQARSQEKISSRRSMDSQLNLDNALDNQLLSQEEISHSQLKAEKQKVRQTEKNNTPYKLREWAVELHKQGENLIKNQELTQARECIEESLNLFRDLRTDLEDSPQILRDLSVSLNKLGEVEPLSGRLDAARAAYAESPALRRDLRTDLEDSPQILRDLSVSLNKLGEVELLSGRLDAARAAYAESLTLCRGPACRPEGQSPDTARLVGFAE